jgi:hypothetical protein
MKVVRGGKHRGALTLVLFCLVGSALAQFSGVRSKVELVGDKRPAKPPNCEVEIFGENKPEKKYEVVARMDVYVRRNKITQGRQATYEEAVPELKKQACKAGADAVIVLRQTVSSSGEFKLLYVKAEAIHFTND